MQNLRAACEDETLRALQIELKQIYGLQSFTAHQLRERHRGHANAPCDTHIAREPFRIPRIDRQQRTGSFRAVNFKLRFTTPVGKRRRHDRESRITGITGPQVFRQLRDGLDEDHSFGPVQKQKGIDKRPAIRARVDDMAIIVARQVPQIAESPPIFLVEERP